MLSFLTSYRNHHRNDDNNSKDKFISGAKKQNYTRSNNKVNVNNVHELPVILPEVYATLAACVYQDINLHNVRWSHNENKSLSSSERHLHPNSRVHISNICKSNNSISNSDSEYNIVLPTELPANWKLLLTCKFFNLNREGYFAAAFVNHSLKHCIIAERGTCDVFGLRAGLWMYFDELTIQLFLAEQFSKELQKWMKSSVYAHYTMSYTGHSLGAVIASLRALQENVYAVTFEPPGCKPLLTRLLGDEVVAAAQGRIVSYLNQPNPINTLKSHCGLLIALPIVAHEMPSGTLMLAVNNNNKYREGEKLVEIELDRKSLEATNNFAPYNEVTNVTAHHNTGNTEPNVACNKNKNIVIQSSPLSSTTSTTTNNIINNNNNNLVSEKLIRASSSSPPSHYYSYSLPSQRRLREMFTLPSSYKPSSLRAYALSQTRGYLFNSVGIPELQQYLSKVEPLIREMLEQTQQEHSIHNFVRYFAQQRETQTKMKRIDDNNNNNNNNSTSTNNNKKQREEFAQNHFSREPHSHFVEDNNGRNNSNNDNDSNRMNEPHFEHAKSEAIVTCWPSSVLQFVEYYNTLRALDDPANESHPVHAAYNSMLDKLYQVKWHHPCQLPRCYIDDVSLKLWHSHVTYEQMLLQQEQQQQYKKCQVNEESVTETVNPIMHAHEEGKNNTITTSSNTMFKVLHTAFSSLTPLERNMLREIYIDANALTTPNNTLFTALQAKEFLLMLQRRAAFVTLTKLFATNTLAKLEKHIV